MRFGALIVGLIFSFSSFGQSIKQMNRELKMKCDVSKKTTDSLFLAVSMLNDNVSALQNRNRNKIGMLLDLYDVVEERKFEFYSLIHKRNDYLIDWTQFYRSKDVSLDQLTAFQSKLEDQALKERSDFGMDFFFVSKKRMNSKEQNAFLKEKAAFYEKSNATLKDKLMEFKEELLAYQEDSLKLTAWEKLISRTNDYCLGNGVSTPVKVKETKEGWLCGTIDYDEITPSVFEISKVGEEPYETIPIFPPGGFEVLKAYFAQEFSKSGIKSEDPHYSGKIYVKFVITDNGEIRDPIITKGVECFKCEKEVLRIVQNMPRWIPATKGGNPVSSVFRLPIKLP
ncbi:energy transducer TonB [Fluviicola sp.]|uniref:energy transducer TonB n=1 Tax=Fluviicola sp. TaxID=1917219 RepID=UPI00260AB3B0|nr:energy transducer TonB [Fluviicola sp.]